MTEAVPAEKPPIWEDSLEIFFAPVRVFRRRDGSDVGIPLFVLIVLSIAVYFATRELLQPLMEADIRRSTAAALARQPDLTEEQVEAGLVFYRKFAAFLSVAAAAIVPLLLGFFVWLAGKVVGSAAGLGDMILVTVFALFPRIIQYGLLAIQVLVLPPEQITGQASVSLGPARFLDPDATSPLMMGLLTRVDLFTLWVTVLLALGLRVKGRVSTWQAVVGGILFWWVGAVPVLLSTLRG